MENNWISVEEQLPLHETEVLAKFKNEYNKTFYIVALYISPFTSDYDDIIIDSWQDEDEELKEIGENGHEYAKGGFYENCLAEEKLWYTSDITHWKLID